MVEPSGARIGTSCEETGAADGATEVTGLIGGGAGIVAPGNGYTGGVGGAAVGGAGRLAHDAAVVFGRGGKPRSCVCRSVEVVPAWM